MGFAQLLNEIFDLGALCMYAAYDEAKVRNSYEVLCSRFAAAGLHVPDDADLSEW